MTSGGNERIPWKTKLWKVDRAKALENYRRQFEELPGEFTR